MLSSAKSSPPSSAADIMRERVILASILDLEAGAELPPAIARVLDFAPEGFIEPELGKIAVAIRTAQSNGKMPDLMSIGKHLKGDSVTLLMQIANEGGSVLPLSLAAAEAEPLLTAIQSRRAIELLGNAWQEAQAHPRQAPDIARHAREALAQLDNESPRTPKEWGAMVEDGADLQARELPPLIEIVHGIVAECSKLSIVSSAKCFKTWLTIYLAVSISHGIEFLGRQTTRCKVLYVNLELKPVTFARRFQAIAKALGISVDPQYLFHLSLRGKIAGLSVREIVTRIMAVANMLGATVIVVDPLFKLNTEGEENSSRDQTIFCNELDRLTTEGHCTAIFNDHSGKGNQSEKDPLDVIRGSSAKGGDLDAALVLRKHEVEGCFRVDLVHRELPPVTPFTIAWRYPAPAWP
jgi:RecA-family ATPase